MINRVKQYMLDNNMASPGQRVIIGVSGGPDSMALLHILKELRECLDISLAAAHLNHQIRPEAEAEEAYVKMICQEWQVPCYVRQADVLELAARSKKTVEEAGRDARYQFFSDLLTELPAHRIATAHHQDDVAETVLLHLIRGTGIKGLRGIMPVSGAIIRPLLGVDRTAVLEYLEQNHISYCTDQSNYDTGYLRNRIRLQLIPLLREQYNPRISESLNQLALIARGENQVLEEACRTWWPQVVEDEKEDLISLDYPALSALLPGMQRRIIMQALSRLAGESGWGMEDINMVMDLAARKGSSRVVHLKKGLKVNKSYGKLVFTFSLSPSPEFSYPVPVPGRVIIKETGEVYSFDLVDKISRPEPGCSYLDYDKMGPLELRSRRPGDVFSPSGMKGSKKLKKFLIDLKVPFFERDKIPLLVSGNEIYAVLGYRLGKLASVDDNTRKIIVIKKEAGDKIIK